MTRTRKSPPRANAERIADSLVRAIVEGRLTPGTRIVEDELAQVFSVSRTVVRQALTRLASEAIVAVRPKKGWFVVEPSEDEVRDAFGARRLIEGGLLRAFVRRAGPREVASLRDHLAQQHAAVNGEDIAHRTHLLGDFHVQLALAAGNRCLARIVEDLVTRTLLMSMLYQSTQEASHSADEHDAILAAIAAGDADAAARLMEEHIANVEAGLRHRKEADPVERLKQTLRWNAPAPIPPPPDG